MAAIVHRCACGHLDLFHSSVSGTCTAADCPCPALTPGPPEVIPTWRADGAATGPTIPEPRVIAPGTNDGPGLGRLCNCQDCLTLYASVAGNAA